MAHVGVHASENIIKGNVLLLGEAHCHTFFVSQQCEGGGGVVTRVNGLNFLILTFFSLCVLKMTVRPIRT
jgi:hypothetical protein